MALSALEIVPGTDNLIFLSVVVGRLPLDEQAAMRKAGLLPDGFGAHVPKGYIYAAIGFSALVEALNSAKAAAEFAPSDPRRRARHRWLRCSRSS